MYRVDNLDKKMSHILGMTELDVMIIHHTSHNGRQFNSYELIISGIFYLIFLDRGWPRTTKTRKSETTDKCKLSMNFRNHEDCQRNYRREYNVFWYQLSKTTSTFLSFTERQKRKYLFYKRFNNNWNNISLTETKMNLKYL